MRADNHDVRTDVKVVAGIIPRLVRYPRSDVHVSNAYSRDVRLAAGEALFHPLQKYRIKTARLIVRIARNARQTGPFVRALVEKSILPARPARPIENRRV